jgi:hypothetical protein
MQVQQGENDKVAISLVCCKGGLSAEKVIKQKRLPSGSLFIMLMF